MDAFARLNGSGDSTRRHFGWVRERTLRSWDSVGKDVESGKLTFGREAILLSKGEPVPNTSGRVEMLENLLNSICRIEERSLDAVAPVDPDQ
jgi:hypothetical protein